MESVSESAGDDIRDTMALTGAKPFESKIEKMKTIVKHSSDHQLQRSFFQEMEKYAENLAHVSVTDTNQIKRNTLATHETDNMATCK